MKYLRTWIAFIVYLMIWIFAIKLFELYTKKYSDNDLKKICIGGIIFFGLIYNMDYVKH